ncbi:MAG: diguanylate cyclase, partial [Rhodospirillaceae bacterium]
MSDAVSELARLRAALAAAGDLVYDWDLVNDRIDWLDGSPRSLEYFSGKRCGPVKRFHDRIHPEDLRQRLDAVAALHQGRSVFECEFRIRDGSGNHQWYHEHGSVELDAAGRPVRLRGTMRPIGEQKDENQRIQYLASYDELTGHFNKTRLREALEQSLNYSARYRVGGAFLVVGIDNINVVNQAFGYDIADAVIVAVGNRLDQCLRSSDV